MTAAANPIKRAKALGGDMTADAARFMATPEATATAEGRAETRAFLESFIGRRKAGRRPATRTDADQQGEARYLYRNRGFSIEQITARFPNLTSDQINDAIAKSARGRITAAEKSAAAKFGAAGFE